MVLKNNRTDNSIHKLSLQRINLSVHKELLDFVTRVIKEGKKERKKHLDMFGVVHNLEKIGRYKGKAILPSFKVVSQGVSILYRYVVSSAYAYGSVRYNVPTQKLKWIDERGK